MAVLGTKPSTHEPSGDSPAGRMHGQPLAEGSSLKLPTVESWRRVEEVKASEWHGTHNYTLRKMSGRGMGV